MPANIKTKLRNGYNSLKNSFSSLWRRQPVVVVALALSPLLILLIGTLWPRTIVFSYAEPTCVRNFLLLPDIHKVEASTSYDMEHHTPLTIGDYPLLASSSCISATTLPSEEPETIQQHLFHIPFAYTAFKVSAPDEPVLKTTPEDIRQIPVTEPLMLELDQPDIVSTYSLISENEAAECSSSDSQLYCPVQELELEQAQEYEISLSRSINGSEPSSLIETTVETVTPITIESSSIKDGALVRNAPDSITLTTDKPIDSYDGLRLTSADNELAFEVEVDEDTLTLKLNEELEREASFSLTLQELIAEDRGFLTEPYELSFETSGGPKVTNINLPRYGVSRNARPVLSFDYDVSTEQDLGSVITIEASGTTIPFTTYVAGRSVTLIPASQLPRCAAFEISVSEDIENRHGISGGETYSFSARTLCQQVSTIGSSVEGRAIQAYSFGEGSQKILYLGGIHGNEPSSKYILDSWINELEANPGRIPSSRTIVVVPNLNPDGIVRGSRMNSRSVDLNRNFPTANWQSDISGPNGSVKGGGGSKALSEPEARAIANFISAQRPRFILSYHAVGPFTIANDAGNSRELTTRYSQMIGYPSYTSAQAGSIFSYDISGALEDWLRESPGLPGMLIELTSYTGNEFVRHREAMWQAATQ